VNEIYAEIKREELKLREASPPYQKPEVFALAYALSHIGDALFEIAKSLNKEAKQ
jgi:hypothetical protein